MPDSRLLQCYVYACPRGQRNAAAAVLADHDLDLDWDYPRPAAGLSLTRAYTGNAAVGTAGTIAAELREAAPGCSFVVWEDPKYQWLGSLEAYTPALGRFSADCDSDGVVLCTLTEATRLIENAAAGQPGGAGSWAEQAVAAFETAMGGPWFSDWHAARPAPAQPPRALP